MSTVKQCPKCKKTYSISNSFCPNCKIMLDTNNKIEKKEKKKDIDDKNNDKKLNDIQVKNTSAKEILDKKKSSTSNFTKTTKFQNKAIHYV